MSKRLLAMFAGSAALVLAIAWVLQPHTFEDCVLAHVKPGLSDQATGAVYAACRAKFSVTPTSTGASRSQGSSSSFDWEQFWGNPEASQGTRAPSPRWDRVLAFVLAPVMLLWAIVAKVSHVAGLRARWYGWLASFLLTWAGSAASIRVLGDTSETFVLGPFLFSVATLGLLAFMTKRPVAGFVVKSPAASLDISKVDAPK